MKRFMLINLVFLFSFAGMAIAGPAQNVQREVSRVLPKSASISCKDGVNDFGKEVNCAVRIKPGFPRNSKNYHDLQALAREVAIALRNSDLGLDFSVMAIADNNIPLARFLYSVKFDYLTPIYMWR